MKILLFVGIRVFLAKMLLSSCFSLPYNQFTIGTFVIDCSAIARNDDLYFVFFFMFTIDREDGARMLEVSTRTIDRYIRSGKIRAKKRGKKVFLHEEDVRAFKTE